MNTLLDRSGKGSRSRVAPPAAGASLGPRAARALLAALEQTFEEMPAMRLTAAQAARLCGLDLPTARAALSSLVERGYLAETSDGQYGRRDLQWA